MIQRVGRSRAGHEAAAGHDQPLSQLAAAVQRLAPNLSPAFANWVTWRIPAAALAGQRSERAARRP